MSDATVRRVLIAVAFLEIAAQANDARPVDVGNAIERVVAGFREVPKSFSDEQRARAIAAIESAYVWRQARVAAFLEEMNDAFATGLEDAKDLINRR